MDDQKHYLTKENFEKLQAELEELTTVRRREIAEQLEYAKSLGDLSENAEYHDAREAQAKTEARIIQLEEMLKRAEIVKHRKGTTTIQVGSTVTIQKKRSKDSKTFYVVGAEEADMATRKISYLSPLGAALMGKKKGDDFTFEAPSGKVSYTILEVE